MSSVGDLSRVRFFDDLSVSGFVFPFVNAHSSKLPGVTVHPSKCFDLQFGQGYAVTQRGGTTLRARKFLYSASLVCPIVLALIAAAEEPKPRPDNTISIKLENEIKPQTFSRPLKFFVDKVVDRSANPQPVLVLKERGGIFLDRQPTEIVQQAFQETLQKSGLLAADREHADYLLTVYVFHFGLAPGIGFEYFGKVDLNVVVKDLASGKSQEVTALGTSIQGAAFRKKNMLKNIEANISEALEAALRNFMRGTKLRDAVASPPDAKPPAAPQPSSERSTQTLNLICCLQNLFRFIPEVPPCVNFACSLPRLSC